MRLGRVMIGLKGTVLQSEERELLLHPCSGGVILFARNYESPEQVRALTRAIHTLKVPALLVAVDHEGGRVQRFRKGFTHLPPVRVLGQYYDRDPQHACWLAMMTGWLMAAELRAVGIDFSFAPVLDLEREVSTVIGERAFHPEPGAVVALAQAYIKGMKQAGMVAVGKHFPGHGSVAADSHVALPVDDRPWQEIQRADLVPFAKMVRLGLSAVMPAHVVYPSVDTLPAGFSHVWLQTILRRQLGFQGALISDDLGMAGAAVAGDLSARVSAALKAGCDMALVGNDTESFASLLEALSLPDDPQAHTRLLRLQGCYAGPSLSSLYRSQRWQKAAQAVAESAKFWPLADCEN